VPGYPSNNTFYLCTISENPPQEINAALEELQSFSAGSQIPELLRAVSSQLEKAFAIGSQYGPVLLNSQYSDIDEDEDDSDESADYWPPGSPTQTSGPVDNSSGHVISIVDAKSLDKRIKADLRAVKEAGFKVGILSGMRGDSHCSMLSISIQVSRLGLSDEAIQAWDLQTHQYIVLLIRYAKSYKTMETIRNLPARSEDVEFRIGVSDYYKPTMQATIAAFTNITTEQYGNTRENGKPAGFNSLFISSSHNALMKDEFISLLKTRIDLNVGWDTARLFFSDMVGRLGAESAKTFDVAHEEENTSTSKFPPFLCADHIVDAKSTNLSFPLIAMQFAMRHVIRCTEFCLVCHSKVEQGFEALKPYVCSKGLCLYQYMSLGFGPSIEHEILTQPYVVDLLVSFCYAGAKAQRLREYPTGMSLAIPPAKDASSIPNHNNMGFNQKSIIETEPGLSREPQTSIEVRYDSEKQEIILEQENAPSLRRGDWIILRGPGRVSVHHRIEEVMYPTIKLSTSGISPSSTLSVQEDDLYNHSITGLTPATTPPPNIISKREMLLYNQNFDDLTEPEKCATIIMLLETIPSIKELQIYLKQQRQVAEASLRQWLDRISPAALGLLRWIVASNRSCIVQIDRCPGQEVADVGKIRFDQKVSNMEGWVQFRFAQGSPDKEQRFHKALQEVQQRLNKPHPTIFAWHGSSLANWHSIIRTGLDFKEIQCGRAYGNGCYHSRDLNTSRGYSDRGMVSYKDYSSALCHPSKYAIS
jgi:ubiquitin-conjugating enzyme E2 Q